MPKSLTNQEAYTQCGEKGSFLPQQKVDTAKIKTMLAVADEDLQTVAELKNKRDRVNTLYKLSYDAIHILSEALLLFDKMKCLNHQCLFAYICFHHPELELDWNFFEKIRTKRNGIHYYGTAALWQDWKTIELQSELYVKILKKIILDKLEKP